MSKTLKSCQKFFLNIFPQLLINTLWRRRCVTFCTQQSKETETFLAAFPEVLETVTESNLFSGSHEFKQHYKELIEYTVLKEKRFRPSLVIESYKALEGTNNISEEKLKLMTMFAWSIELLHTAMIMQDDLWDQSETRGNDVCWYRRPNVGLISINDGALIYEGAFTLLKKYFSPLKMYTSLTELLHYVNLATCVGQSLTWKCKRDGQPVYEKINMEMYRTIARYKASPGIIEGPLIGALILTDNLSVRDSLTDLFEEIGVAGQIDNDILDIYEKNGTVRQQVGSDIREGTCSWPAVNILESGNDELIQTFKLNYGRSEPECVQEVLRIFDKFGIYEKYREYSKSARRRIEDQANEMRSPLKRAILGIVENVLPNLANK